MAVGSVGGWYVPGSYFKRFFVQPRLHESVYTSGSIYKRFEASWYTSGSQYQRFRYTDAQLINRRAVEAFDAQVASSGSIIFGQTSSQSEQVSILAVKQLQTRLAEEAAARVSGARLNLSI